MLCQIYMAWKSKNIWQKNPLECTAINIFSCRSAQLHNTPEYTQNDRKELSVKGICNDLSCEVDMLRILYLPEREQYG